MSTNSKHFRIGKSIEEVMLQRSIEADTLPPVLTSQHLQQTVNKANKVRRQSNKSTRSTSSGQLEALRMSASGGRLPSPNNTYENFIMESLMEHCRNLQARVQDLETKLTVCENEKEGYLYDLDNLRQQMESKDLKIAELNVNTTPNLFEMSKTIPTPLISAARQSYNKPRSPMKSQQKGENEVSTTDAGETDAVISRPMSRQENEEAVVHTVNDMDGKIRELRLIFHPRDPIEERTAAVIKIGALIRGWLARQRYMKYWKGLYRFRYGRVKKFLCLIETGLTAAGNIQSGTRSLIAKRNTNITHKIFDRWSYLCRQTAPFRRANMLIAENKYQAKVLELLRLTFDAFKDGTIGGDSHKHLRQQRRAMVARLRDEMIEKHEKSDSKRRLIITELDLQRAVYSEIVTTSLEKRDHRNKRKILDQFRYILEKSVVANKTAKRHMFAKFAGKCFYAWSDWTYTVGSGLERKRWPGPRKYEVRYNRKLVEHFVKGRLKKMTFKPWKRFARTQVTVNLMFARKLTAFVKDNFLAWRATARRYAELRKHALGMWMGYANDIVASPFTAWKDLAVNAVQRRIQQDRLVNAYSRWKQRQKLIKILQTWRHQALYGGVEGMYSRTAISKSLGEQKSLCASLQKMISRQTVDLEESKELVNREVILRKKMEDSVVDKDSEIERLKMKCHHVDQELKRLLAIIESMAKINPAQVALLKELQPEFNFQERKIQPSLAAGGDGLLEENEEEEDNSQTTGPGFSDRSMTDILGFNDDKSVVSEPAYAKMSTIEDGKSSMSSSKKERRVSTSYNNSSVVSDVSLEDKRLLLRIKWVLSTLFPDVRPYNKMDDNEARLTALKNMKAFQETSEGESDDDNDEDDDRSRKEPDEIDLKNTHMSADEKRMERRIRKLLDDPAESAELSFTMGILSFLKDGTTKALSKKDGREWAKVLLKSAGRDTDIVNLLLPDSDMSPKNDQLVALDTNSNEMDDWRSLLIHLKTFYPVGGMVGRAADVVFKDDQNAPTRGVLSRIRTMRSDLKDVVKYKVEKASKSKIGKSIETNLALSEELADEDINEMYGAHDDTQPGINLYASNLINHVGGETVKDTFPNESDTADNFDDVEDSISEYDPNRKSQLLSMHGDILKHVTEENSNYSSQFTLPSGSK